MFNINLEEGRAFFKKCTENESIKTRMNCIWENTSNRVNVKHERKTIVGKPIKLEDRTIYPIIKLLTIESLGNLNSATISPVALVIEESEDEHFIPITKKEIEPKDIIEMISGEENSEKVIELLRKMI